MHCCFSGHVVKQSSLTQTVKANRHRRKNKMATQIVWRCWDVSFILSFPPKSKSIIWVLASTLMLGLHIFVESNFFYHICKRFDSSFSTTFRKLSLLMTTKHNLRVTSRVSTTYKEGQEKHFGQSPCSRGSLLTPNFNEQSTKKRRKKPSITKLSGIFFWAFAIIWPLHCTVL